MNTHDGTTTLYVELTPEQGDKLYELLDKNLSFDTLIFQLREAMTTAQRAGKTLQITIPCAD